jgi:xylulokinase
MNLLGIDVGTTGCKAVLFEPSGKLLGYGFQEYGIDCDEPEKAEQDAERVFQFVLGVVRKAVENSDKRSVKALAISVQGDAIIPIDRRGRALHPAILGMDYRSADHAERCAHDIGAWELFLLTGMRPHPINSIVKLLWLKENKPSIYAKAWKIVTYEDFFLNKFIGEPIIDYSMASRTMAFDLKRRRWAVPLLEKLDINPDLLSKAEPSGKPLGTLRKEFADTIGLGDETLVVCGGHDASCSALGGGADHESLGVLVAGTADVLTTAFTEPKLNNELYEGFYPCYIHSQPDMYFTFSLNHVGGILFRWFRDNFCGDIVKAAQEVCQDPYDMLLNDISDLPSPLMILPHFNGSGNPFCDMNAKGVVVGLTLASKRVDFVKAILESLAFEMKINMARMEKAGIRILEIRVVGGGARSPKWLQIRADILGRNVSTLEVREAACLGAAILAGAGSGVYKSISEGVCSTVKVVDCYQPDLLKQELYSQRFSIYKDLYPALKTINPRI